MVDARVLLAEERFTGAYHAGGLALECALKARIAKLTVAGEFPDRDRTRQALEHNPSKLLGAAELLAMQRTDVSPTFQSNWATVKDWTVDSRYDPSPNPVTVKAFLDALDDPTDGVLQWVRRHC